MLIDKNEIKKYLSKIPPLKESVRLSLKYLNEGDVQKAAQEVDKDLILKKKIENIVNSAYYSLPNYVNDTKLLFMMIGIESVRSIILSHMVEIIAPKEWKLFKIDFNSFQAIVLNQIKEAIILETDEPTYKKYADSIALIPASVVIVDELLGSKKELNLILENSNMKYGDVLKRFTDTTIFQIASLIAKAWELNIDNQQFLKFIECNNCNIKNENTKKAAAASHLNLFYIFSKPEFIDLNSLIEFNLDTINIATKNFEKLQKE